MDTGNRMKKRFPYEEVEVVIGWDVGDGDNVSFAKSIAKREIFSLSAALYMHKSRSEQILKSVLAKGSDGKILIGEDAAKQKNFVINFKRSPRDWNSKSYLNVENRQHMFDFLNGGSDALLQNSANRSGILNSVITLDSNGNPHWKKGKVLLVVGCPASVIWKGESMRRQYEKLISEATGIDHVIVTEESRAAVVSLLEVDNLRKSIDLQKGVLVLDLGSSTGDATFFLPGRKMINLSWELGAAEIEHAMLDYILKSEKTRNTLEKYARMYDKNRLIVAKNKCSHSIFQLRGEKEAYYDGKLNGDTIAQSVQLPVMDEDGNSYFDDGEPVTISIPYNVTESMMQYAVDGYEFAVKKDGEIVSCGTWKQNYRRFLEDVKQTLEREKEAVHTIVITGGGSNMPFTVDLCKKVFSDSMVIASDTPSHSVVKGLVTIAYNEVKAPAIREKAMEKLGEKFEKNADQMVDNITKGLTGKAYDAAIEAVRSLTRDESGEMSKWKQAATFTSVGEITRKIDCAVKSALDRNKKQQIEKSMRAWKDADASEIVEVLDQASAELYTDKAMRDMVKISKAEVGRISSQISLPDITMPDIAENSNLIGMIVGCIVSAVVFAVLAAVSFAAGIPYALAFVMVVGAKAGEAIVDFCTKYEKTPVPLICVSSTANKMEKNRDQKLSELEEPIRKELREYFTKDEVYGEDFKKNHAVLQATAQKAFDRILLASDDIEYEG